MTEIYNLKTAPAFGFESRNIRSIITTDHLELSDSEIFYQNRNAAKVGGYFPGVGVGIGSIRIYRAIKRHDEKFYNTKFMILRGVIEILGIGIILLPIDKYVSYKRKRKWIKMNSLDIS